jgi:hypothetical protein
MNKKNERITTGNNDGFTIDRTASGVKGGGCLGYTYQVVNMFTL